MFRGAELCGIWLPAWLESLGEQRRSQVLQKAMRLLEQGLIRLKRSPAASWLTQGSTPWAKTARPRL